MSDGFELRATPGKGEGIFATRSFQAGETVMVGIIEKVLDKNDSHASQIAKDKYVRHAGLISKVNHSCDPNCGIKVNQTGGHDFVAMRNINVNEEITFDYAMRNYSIDHFLMLCECGSKNCRKKITGWKDLPESRKKEYTGFVAPYLLELDLQKVS
ncbi:MAG: SET domain-containing protein-lysine N-methyltransferase [Calothrix sp. MO_167.B12]|nr:SET domain-containing protein-lysine N-methyltransferase [Calothrix sp. MO_167.B12]